MSRRNDAEPGGQGWRLAPRSFASRSLRLACSFPAALTGVYHRSFAFEGIVRGIESFVSAAGQDAQRRQLYLRPASRSVRLGQERITSSPFRTSSEFSQAFTRPEKELPELH